MNGYDIRTVLYLQLQKISMMLELQGLQDPVDVKKVLDNQTIRKQLRSFDAKFLPFYETISETYLEAFRKDISDQDFGKKIQTILADLKIDRKKGQKKVCMKRGRVYYRCDDCTEKNMAYCTSCFEFSRHIGHNFTLAENQSNGCFCDCGNKEVMNIQGMCFNHSTFIEPKFDESQLNQSKDLFIQLFSLSISLKLVKSQLPSSKKQMLLAQLLKFVQKLLQQSYYYMKVMAEVLVRKPNKIFLYHNKIIFQLLMEETLNQQAELALILLLNFLMAEAQLMEALFPIGLRMASTKGSKMTKEKLLVFSGFANNVGLYHSIFINLMNQHNLKFLVITQAKPSFLSLQTFLIFYQQLFQHSPETFYQMVVMIVKHIPIDKWINFSFNGVQITDQQIKILNDAIYRYFLNIFTAIRKYCTSIEERNIIELKMIRESFRVILSKKSSVWVNRIFVLSFLSYKNFDLSELDPKQILSMLDLNLKQTPETATILLDLITTQLWKPIVVHKKQQQEMSFILVQCSISYLWKRLLIRLNQVCRESKQNFIQLLLFDCLQKNDFDNLRSQESFKSTMQAMQHFALNVKNYIFCHEAEFLPLLIRNYVQDSGNEGKITSFYRELAVVYAGKTRKEFHSAAIKWINRQQLIKSFILSEYSSIKSTDHEFLKTQTNLSFNSPLCNFELIADRKMRFRAKLERKQVPNFSTFLGIRQQQCQQIVGMLEEFNDKVRDCFKDQKKKQLSIVVNTYFEMLVTLFLETRSQVIREMIQKIIDKEKEDNILNAYSKQLMSMYLDLMNKKIDKANEMVKDPKTQRLTKKQQKLREMKQRQQRIMSSKDIQQYSQKKNENVCIVCKMAEQKQALFYLCHVKFGNVLMKKILKSSRQILLFTTCGHLIHESCLNQSYEGNENFASNYKCFLCKRTSNIRLPFATMIANQSTVRIIFDQILTIVSLDAANLSEMYEQLKISQSSILKRELDQKTFPQQIYSSIVYQIYLHFLSHSQMFVYYMLPIMPNLISLLKFYQFQRGTSTFELEEKMYLEENKLIHQIQRNIHWLLQGKSKHFTVIEEEVKVEQIKNQQQQELLSQQQLSIEIDKLFMRMAGLNPERTKRIKNTKRFRFYRPPDDIYDLKRQAQICPDCQKPSDNIRICFECDQRSCDPCSDKNVKAWGRHRNLTHKGALVNIVVRDGCIAYQGSNSRTSFKSLYQNYLGNFYCYSSQRLKKGQYMLSQLELEKIYEDLALQRVDPKTHKNQEFREINNCRVQ